MLSQFDMLTHTRARARTPSPVFPTTHCRVMPCSHVRQPMEKSVALRLMCWWHLQLCLAWISDSFSPAARKFMMLVSFFSSFILAFFHFSSHATARDCSLCFFFLRSLHLSLSLSLCPSRSLLHFSHALSRVRALVEALTQSIKLRSALDYIILSWQHTTPLILWDICIMFDIYEEGYIHRYKMLIWMFIYNWHAHTKVQ